MQHEQHDELVGLFSRTMNISGFTPSSEIISNQVLPPPAAVPQPTQTHYASVHYTHSQHIAPPRFAEPTSTLVEQPSDEQLVQVLVQNNIDPHSLSAAQVNLLRNADSEQRPRLLELWRISP